LDMIGELENGVKSPLGPAVEAFIRFLWVAFESPWDIF